MQFPQPALPPPPMPLLHIPNPLLSFLYQQYYLYLSMRYCLYCCQSGALTLRALISRASCFGLRGREFGPCLGIFYAYILFACSFGFSIILFLECLLLAYYNLMKEQSRYDQKVERDLIGKITYHEQINVDSKNRGLQQPSNKKVFILLTGGTIGMFPNHQGKYAPAPDRFKEFLKKYQYFCDEDETYFNSNNDFIITPPSIAGYPISYKYFQLPDLIDSTNMNIDRLNMILSKIEEVYDEYDAFIILHGTDTMAYTASALSFMIENLKKTIIVTGAQIPIKEARNDAVNNLLSSLTIAGHYSIPEVLVIFDNKILRGNRTTKFSTASFQAFKSPNFYPIGELGLSVSIKWQKIFPCNRELPTTFVKIKEQVQIQKLSPFGYKTTPSTKYVVIQSFGIGNIPTQGPFYDWVVANSKLPESERKVLVNISQVFQSVIKNTYETGQMAFKLGMIPGSDMTCEAAISKLSYLVTKGYKKFQEINEMMGRNLRGELTEEQDRFNKQKQNYALNCMTVLDRQFGSRTKKQKQILIQIIFPTIIFEKPSKAVVNRLQQYNFDVHKVFPDGSNLLHRLMRIKHHNLQAEYELVLDMLLKENISTTLIDNSGNSAAFYGIQNTNYGAVARVMDKGGVLKTTTSRVFKAIAEEDLPLLHGLAKFGDKFEYTNSQGRNCAFISVIKRQQKMINFFKEFTSMFQQQNLKAKDIYGFPLSFYLQKFGYKQPSEPENQSPKLLVITHGISTPQTSFRDLIADKAD